MATENISLNMTKVRLVEGARYMTNVATRDKHGKSPIFPYSQERIDRCPTFKEIHPVFESAPKAVQAPAIQVVAPVPEKKPFSIEVPAFSLEQPIAIENPVISAAQQQEMAQEPEAKESPREAVMRAVAQKTGKKLTVRRKK